MSNSKAESKAHNYSTMNQANSEKMLKDIRVKLAAHQKETERKSVTPSPVTIRETATPSPISELTSPGSVRSKHKVSIGGRSKQKMKMDQIRNSLKPHHRSDPGFQAPTDLVNPYMLRQLISRGYDEVNETNYLLSYFHYSQ